MLRLALPTITVLVAQALVGVAETYFVSFLGTEALAGVALVFPVLMLVQMMSNGGIGGGVASAVARALGADRDADAQALAWLCLERNEAADRADRLEQFPMRSIRCGSHRRFAHRKKLL
jgi:Na+-driven multidrug efflux pump